MEAFNPQRFKIARMRRGMSPWAVADALGLRLPLVMQYVRGTKAPDTLTVEHMAEVLDFPPAFFYGPDLQEPPLIISGSRIKPEQMR